jgi:hypothetical protein
VQSQLRLSKDDVIDPRARSLKARALLYMLPELGNHLTHNLHLESFNGQAPQDGVSGRRHCHSERGKPHSHPGVVGGCKPHSLVQRGTNYGQAQLGPSELHNCNLID